MVDNKPIALDDMYNPRWTSGIGVEKEGVCPLCWINGELRTFRTKVSAYWYHMNFFHGISSATCQPYEPPRAVRQVVLTTRLMMEGYCHQCSQWIPLESIKIITVNVRQIYWWKHAQKCHIFPVSKPSPSLPPTIHPTRNTRKRQLTTSNTI
ncbi:hypothetical protein BJ085DRAFT_14893 [Dimargaris cristalligena]|uniref:Transcription regulator Rua1 C-terminal domain-containing protein n=1 Tax=Dimargaris cristalligena TaxID=215637 RepID=A0A4P9ZU51_9FUNG|nr:hypothetical protein BJ085DRAFT_14893 [Dimargaris cristalligena]|eukprot:RKP36110.1 hypothetical protein BJ085DRAFT_14893 [Dimargaris cristalligena]